MKKYSNDARKWGHTMASQSTANLSQEHSPTQAMVWLLFSKVDDILHTITSKDFGVVVDYA